MLSQRPNNVVTVMIVQQINKISTPNLKMLEYTDINIKI